MIRPFVVAVISVTLCAAVYSILPADSLRAESNPIYKDGDTYVELKDAEDLKGASGPFSHPYIIDVEKLKKVLSSISFREKGVLSTKGGGKVFTKTETERLASLISDALSKSTADEYLYVYSPRGRPLLNDLETVFSLFVIDEDMNIAFSRVQARIENVPGSNRSKTPSKDPTSMKDGGFWELAVGDGQKYKEGHRNWLIINLREKAFDVKPPAASMPQEEGEYDSYSRTDPVMEERLKKIEEQIGLTSPDNSAPPVQVQPSTPSSSGDDDGNMNQKFRDLKELLDNDLISPEDYQYKKKELLKRESQTKKSIPQRLKDLRSLMDEGLITDKDYEAKKRELLDRL